MRRPDLPLILLVLAVGIVLAVFVDGSEPTALPGAEEGTEDAGPTASLLAQPTPALLRCAEAEAPPGAPDGELPGDPKALIEAVSRRVEALRELRFERPVDARFLSPAELRRDLGKRVDEELEPSELADEGRILELLGAIPPDTDLEQLVRDALGSQVVGLYDPPSQRLLVQSSGQFDLLEAITLAHELDHALADQRLELREEVGSDPTMADHSLAYTAVVEGDATMLTQRYSAAYVDFAEQLSVGESGVPGAAHFEQLPPYVQRNLVFPYLEGLRLVCYQWNRGGWAAVDDLYHNPPEGTHEVLFPARYGDAAPTDPRDPGEPPGWRRAVARELGAAELEWLFAAPGADTEASLAVPRTLVAGWAGGELELWTRGPESAVGIAVEELSDFNRLCAAMAAWYGAGRTGAEVERPEGGALDVVFSEDGQAAALACTGDEIRMGIAPEPQVAKALAT